MGNKELINYVQKITGIILSGKFEKILPLLYGHGNNGKSVFMATIKYIMGAYAKHIPVETLMSKFFSTGGNSPELAKLRGIRFVSATEVEGNKWLNEALVKELTGGEMISACAKYRDPFEFLPHFKIWMSGNQKPNIRGTDKGIWSRLKLIPFDCEIKQNEIDPKIWDKLKIESSGILNWMLQGYAKYQKEGLLEPEIVKIAVEEYKKESDLIGQWIEDCVIEKIDTLLPLADAFQSFRNWAEANNVNITFMSKIKLGKLLSEKEWVKSPIHNKWSWHNKELIDQN